MILRRKRAAEAMRGVRRVLIGGRRSTSGGQRYNIFQVAGNASVLRQGLEIGRI